MFTEKTAQILSLMLVLSVCLTVVFAGWYMGRQANDDRHDLRSTLIASQLPVDQWHTAIGDATLADAILDRLIHNAHRIPLKGGSMRKRKAQAEKLSP